MTTFTGQPGQNNNFVGGAGADSFLFAVPDLDSGDTLSGGGGTDTLVLSGTGTLAASRLTGLSSIEAISYANGGIGMVFSDAVATALGGFVTVTGSAGDDLFDYSAVTLANRAFSVTAGSGNDTLRGGAANDSFHFAIAELTAADTVSGGAGTDTLFLDTAGTIGAANLAGVSGVERITLANGTNSVTLAAGIALGLPAPLTVNGNAGNDTINASALVDGTSRVEFNSGGGLDVLTGGAGGDTFRFASGDLAGDTVNGGLGYDTVILSGADDLSAADLAAVSNLEQITLSVGGSKITLSTAILQANATTFNIYGSSGNDMVDGTAVVNRSLLVTGGAGSDTFLGGTGSDNFRFNVADLDASDTLAGGGGTGQDQITFLTTGTVAAAQLAGASGIERIAFTAGTNAITLNDAFVSTTSGTQLSLYGTTGNETIDASALTGTNRIDYSASAGNDTVLGGAGDDIFRFAAQALTSADTVTGGAGYDELKLSSNAQVTAAQLAGVSGIEQVTFQVAGTSLILSDAVANANATRLRIFGTAGNDVVDASAVLSGARSVSIFAGAGNDTFKGSAGGDIFQFAAADLTSADLVAGNGGSDQLQLTAAGTVAAASLAGVTGIENIALQVGGISLALADAMVASAAGVVTVTGSSGNDTVDASALGAANHVVIDAAAGNDALTGGAGADNFRFGAANLTAADAVAGGAGSDTLTLNAAGSAALGGNVTGIETLALTAAGVSATIGDAFAAANGPVLAVTGTSGNDTVDASAVTLAGFALATASGAGNDTLKGGAGADTFSFAAADLTGADVVAGGGGASVDTLQLTSAGTITVTGVSGIEAIALAGGTNSLALTSALVGSANGAVVTVAGGTGNDSLTTTGVTIATQRVEFTAGSGTDAYTGGNGIDVLKIAAADLTAADSFAGGTGAAVDQLQFTTAGAVGSTAGVTGVEQFVLNAGGNSVTIGDNTATSVGGTLTVLGGAGNDTVNASAVTGAGGSRVDITAGAGSDALTGGAGNDIFHFLPTDLSGADTVNGGAGTDMLLFGAAGTIAAAQLAGTSNLEQISLNGLGSSIAFDNAALANNAANLAVIGTLGNDTIDASAVTNPARAITVNSGGGNGNGGDDTLRGGAGADTFQFSLVNLTAADTVQGGSGSAIDTLQLTTAGNVTAAALGGFSGIERITLASGTNSIVLSAALVASADGQTLRVVGNGGDDTINGAAAGATTHLDITAGNGNDLLIGGAGSDTFRFATTAFTSADSVSGGDANDTLVFTGAGTIDFTAADNVAGIETIQLDNNDHTVLLSSALVQAATNKTVTVTGGTGADTIDVSNVVGGSDPAVVVNSGDGADLLIDRGTITNLSGDLGAGDDRVEALAYFNPVTLSGGAGSDTIALDSDYSVGSVFYQMSAGVTNFEIIEVNNTGGYSTGTVIANDTVGLLVKGVTADTSYNFKLGNGGQTALGNNLADQLIGGTGADTITAAAGNDVVDGGGGADTVDAGADNDDVRYRAGAVSIAGGLGTDTLHALDGGTFDLSATDQSLGDTVNTTGFENFDGYSFSSVFGSENSTAGVTVTGTSGVNVIEGTSYNDVLDGNGGADTIIGDEGADRITYRGSEAEIDAYYGGGGYGDVAQGDTLVLRTAATIRLAQTDQTTGDAVVVDGFQNVDGSLVTTALNMQGDTYANILIGGSAADNLNGLDGDDTLDGGAGADTLTGGNGNDRVWYDAADTAVSGNADTDTILLRGAGNINLAAGDQGVGDTGTLTGFENADASASTAAVTLRGRNDFVSTLIGGSAGDTVAAGTAGANITGGGGADTLTGSANADEFYYKAGDIVAGETLNAGGGNDTAHISGNVDFTGSTISGLETLQIDTYDPNTGSYGTQPVAVTVTGAQAAAVGNLNFNLSGGSADSYTINVASGTTVSLANINFYYAGAEDMVFVNGAAGNETITGSNIVSTIHGLGGNDTLKAPGTAGSAYWADGTAVYGDAGNDRIDYGYISSIVTLDGGADSDTLVASYNYLNPTVIDLALADQTTGDSVTVANFENVDWSATNFYAGITVYGTSGVNSLIGTANADFIDGRGGADVINAGGGDDIVVYDAADTSILGGTETDKLIVTGAANINLSAADQGVGDTGTMTGFENADASTSTAAVTLRGRNDFISTLIGGSAADSITAGNAGAVITGGAGADALTGSGADDTFYFKAGDVVAGESVNAGGGGNDTAYVSGSNDFSVATLTGLESLQINTYDPVSGTYGTQAVSLTLSGAQAAALGSIYANNSGLGQIDTVTVNVASGTTADLGNLSLGYFGAEDSFLVNGAAGNETITGPAAPVTIHGNGGNDTLKAPGGAGSAYWTDGTAVYGDAGNDRVDYGLTSSTVTLDGGADSDTLVGSYNYTNPTGIDLALADQTTGDNATVANFENVDFSGNAAGYGITVYGTSGVNSLIGTDYTDTIDGRGGADTIDGGGSSDFITYDAADTLVKGGADNDWLIVNGAANINLSAADQGVGDAGTTNGFENVDASGSAVAVTLRGSDVAPSILIGGAGADTITASSTGFIVGGAGADTVTGSDAGNYFDVYSGHWISGDTINAGTGYDYLGVNASTDFTVGTFTGIEQISISAYAYDPTDYRDNSFTSIQSDVTATFTGAQLQGVSSIYANPFYSTTAETVNVQLAAGVATDLSAVSLSYFQAGDTFNVVGSSGNDIYTHISSSVSGAVHGNGGADVLHGEWAGTAVYGDAGNDSIDYAANAVSIDGGADSDTLLIGPSDTVVVNLGNAADQTSGDSVTVTGFENVDASGSSAAQTITGSSGVNLIVGSIYNDTLAGGTGADTFAFTSRSGYADTITDFSSTDDTLRFASTQFDFNGPAFNSAVNDTTGHANIATADLIRYIGGQLNSTSDVSTYLQSNATGIVDGAFIVGQDSNGHSVLYHVTDASGANGDVAFVADLGTITPAMIQLSDFAFV